MSWAALTSLSGGPGLASTGCENETSGVGEKYSPLSRRGEALLITKGAATTGSTGHRMVTLTESYSALNQQYLAP